MTQPTLDTVRVLHVDDQPNFGELVVEFLQREDDRFDVETVGSVREGLDRFAAGQFDCIVSDFNMPGKNGIEFLESVREDAPDVPFILFTGKGSEEVASEAISAGVSDYLQKGSGNEQYELLANRIRTHVKTMRTQRELEERNTHLRQAQEVGRIGSWHLDLSDDELRWSEAVYNLFDVPDEEPLTYEQFLEYVHPADRARVEEAWKDALCGAPYDIEHRVVSGTGEIRWVRERADVEFDEGGNPTSAVGVVQDITDRKEREEELQLFKKAVEAAGNAIYWTDTTGEIQYANPAFEAVTGYPREEAVGQNPRILKSGAHDRAFYGELWETILAGETWQSELVNTTRDGERFVVDQTVAPVEGETGDIEHFVAVNAEITEQKAYQRALREEREFFEHLIDAIDEIFYLITPDGELDRVNRRASAVTGYSTDEILSMDPAAFFAAEDRDRVEADIREAFESGSSSLVAEILTKGGEKIPYEFHKRRLTTSDGEVGGVVGVGRDISERNRRERKLEEQNVRLEKFTSVVGHDLRTPLNVAQGRLDLAREECENPHLENVAGALSRIDSLLEDLLELAQERKEIGTPQPVSLERASNASWQNVETGTATLVVESRRTIRADESRLKQVLENLLRNAVEHGDDDSTVRLGTLPDGFFVADDGPGIPEDEREHVFELGYSTADEGNGFGLSIVRDIARAHGWEICATDSEAGGARFEITSVEFER